jgi:hypothetical protein
MLVQHFGERKLVLTSLRAYAKPVDVNLLVAGVAVWAVAAGIFFRHPIFSSFDQIFGDLGDGSMIVYFHEHLFNVLMGRADFTSPPFFYPQRNVFGLGPAFLLNAVPYATLRLLGGDPFLSFQLIIMILTLASFMASLVICVRYLNIRTSIALCAAVLMTFANNLFVKAGVGHPNFLLLYYIPCIVLITLWGIEDFPHVTRWSILRVATAAALYALLFSTDVYTAWMFGFTLLIAACTMGVLHGRSLMAAVRIHSRPATILIGTATVVFLIAFIPFVIIYVPVRAFAPLRTYREYLAFAPFPTDIINVSVGNLVWGWMVQILRGVRGSEQILAVTPGMTALFLFLAYRLRKNPINIPQWQLAFVAASVAVWLVSWLLTLKIGTVSGFWLVRNLVPGATGIRAGMRVQLIANLWIVLALGIMLEHWIRTAPIAQLGSRKLLAAGALLFCLIEQINLMDNSRLPRSQVLEMLSMVPRPPAECRAFLISLSDENPNYEQQVDAMWISNQVGLPTLNGLSSWTPPGWEINKTTTYLDKARQWIARHGMREKICFYERSERRWSLFQ